MRGMYACWVDRWQDLFRYKLQHQYQYHHQQYQHLIHRLFHVLIVVEDLTKRQGNDISLNVKILKHNQHGFRRVVEFQPLLVVN
jgi:hypothetical protein